MDRAAPPAELPELTRPPHGHGRAKALILVAHDGLDTAALVARLRREAMTSWLIAESRSHGDRCRPVDPCGRAIAKWEPRCRQLEGERTQARHVISSPEKRSPRLGPVAPDHPAPAAAPPGLRTCLRTR